MTELKTKILHIVSNKNIKMIPKWQFALYSVLGIVGILFIFLVAIFTGSLILFVLSRYGFLDLPFFDFMGTLHALSAIPALLLVVTILLLVLIEVVSQKYAFSFRRPLGVTLLAITSVTVLISFAISKTSIHETVRNYARAHHFDMMERAYDRPRPFKGEHDMTVVRGHVTDVSTSSLTVELFSGELRTARLASSSQDLDLPDVGDDVVMFGKIVDDVFFVSKLRTPFFGIDSDRERGQKPGSFPHKDVPRW